MSSSGSFREHAVFLTNHDETIDEALVTVNDGNYSEFSLLSVTRRGLECSIVDQSTVWLAPANMESSTSYAGLLSVGDTIRVGSPADNSGQMGFSDYVTVLEVLGPIDRVYNGLSTECQIGPTLTLDHAGTSGGTYSHSPVGLKYMYRVNTPLNATQLASYLPDLVTGSVWWSNAPVQITHANKFLLDAPHPVVGNPDFAEGVTSYTNGQLLTSLDSWSTNATASGPELRIYDPQGTPYIGLGSTNALCHIEQTFTVIEGHTYTVDVSVAKGSSVAGGVSLATHLVMEAFSTASGSASLGQYTSGNLPANNFTTFTNALTFTADTTNVRLRLTGGLYTGVEVFVNSVLVHNTPIVSTSVPHQVYRMRYPATSELKLTLDRGISDVRRITLVGYHVRSSDPGYLDLNLRSQDYYTLRIKELQGGGGLLSNKSGVHNGFAVLSAGNSVHRPLGAVEYEMHDPAGIATAVVSSAHPLKTLTVEVLNMNGEPAKVNKLHLWFKVLTSSC